MEEMQEAHENNPDLIKKRHNIVNSLDSRKETRLIFRDPYGFMDANKILIELGEDGNCNRLRSQKCCNCFIHSCRNPVTGKNF